jgi:hypothetical protein
LSLTDTEEVKLDFQYIVFFKRYGTYVTFLLYIDTKVNHDFRWEEINRNYFYIKSTTEITFRLQDEDNESYFM